MRVPTTAILSGVCVVILIVSLGVSVAAADPTDDDQPSYQIVQGDQVITLDPIEGDEPVETFYEYRHPHLDRENSLFGRSFSSEGTTEYQEDDTSILMLYDGPDGVSLVAVHDRYHETQADGTPGGSASWKVSGLPDDGEWAVLDDDYGWHADDESKDDIFYFDADHRDGAADADGEPSDDVDAMLSWVWLTGRTDGVAYRGLDEDVSITIDPAFNSESYHRYGDQRRTDEPPDRPGMGERYNGTIDDWQVIVPTDDDSEFERVSLDSLDEPVEIRGVPDDYEPAVTLESVSLEQSRIEPGEKARLTGVLNSTAPTDREYTAEFWVGDTVLQTKTVTVPAGGEQSIEFTQRFTSSGVFTVGIDDEQTMLSVEASADDETNDASDAEQASTAGSNDPNTDANESDPSESDTDEQIPGFGLVVTVAALAVVALWKRRETEQ